MSRIQALAWGAMHDPCFQHHPLISFSVGWEEWHRSQDPTYFAISGHLHIELDLFPTRYYWHREGRK